MNGGSLTTTLTSQCELSCMPSLRGESLREDAEYLLKRLQGFTSEGIPIYAISIPASLIVPTERTGS